jgi:hypothetical protein
MLIATMLLFKLGGRIFLLAARALFQPHAYTKTKGRTFYPRQGGLKLISSKLA